MFLIVLNFDFRHDVLRLWFPQIWAIVEHSSFETSNGRQDLCQLLDSYTANLTRTETSNTSIECIPVSYNLRISSKNLSLKKTIFGVQVIYIELKVLIYSGIILFGIIIDSHNVIIMSMTPFCEFMTM